MGQHVGLQLISALGLGCSTTTEQAKRKACRGDMYIIHTLELEQDWPCQEMEHFVHFFCDKNVSLSPSYTGVGTRLAMSRDGTFCTFLL